MCSYLSIKKFGVFFGRIGATLLCMIYAESLVNQCKIKSSHEFRVYFLTKIFNKKDGLTHMLLCVFVKNYSTRL